MIETKAIEKNRIMLDESVLPSATEIIKPVDIFSVMCPHCGSCHYESLETKYMSDECVKVLYLCNECGCCFRVPYVSVGPTEIIEEGVKDEKQVGKV